MAELALGAEELVELVTKALAGGIPGR